MAEEAWTRQAIISFDGGGIRGYGSLLILRALMEKVGIEERRIDPAIKSSFSPCIYKPTKLGFTTPYTEDFESCEANVLTETKPDGLAYDSLFLPCHYFDYGAGTSTGGQVILISIMLFCLRMTVHDCISEYKILGDKIFGRPRPCSWFGILWPKYSSDSLKRVVNEATGRHNNTGYILNYEVEEQLAQCIVVAYPDSNARGDVPYLFRTYTPPHLARDDVYEKLRSDPRYHPSAIPLHKVAPATAAAPAYFRPVRIMPAHRGIPLPAMRFKDGGFGCNNPSEEAYHDVVEAHEGLSKNIGPFVSIGTGIGKFRLFSNKKGNFRDVCANAIAALKRPTLTTLADKSMSYLANFDKAKRFPYYRFDGGDVLGEIAMDEWKRHKSKHRSHELKQPGAKTLEDIQRAVEAYLHQKGVQRDLEDCAKLLVQRRRLRIEDPSRWERYATTSYYLCKDGTCEKTRFNTSLDFRNHLESCHGFEACGTMDEKLEGCREYWWLYPS